MEDGVGEWRSGNFRRKLVSQIEEAMRKAGLTHTHKKTSEEMENHVYMKAKSREEYLSLVARLIIHFRDIQHKKSQAAAALSARLPAKRARQLEEEREEGPAASEPPPAEEEIPLAQGEEPQPTRRVAAGGGESSASGRDNPVSLREVIEYLQSMKDEIITALAALDHRLKAIEDKVSQHTE